MTRRILVNLLLTCVALAIALAVAEFTVRLFYKDRTVLFPRYHTGYQYGPYRLRGIRPNVVFQHTSIDGSWTFITNSKGLRNTTDFPYSKAKGTLRVLSLGDSQTQGYEVRQEATFSAVLEHFLNGRGVHAEVLNSGVSGFGTAEELAFLENEGYRYEPDVVVLAFYSNDFVDNIKAGLFRLDEPDRLVEAKFEHIPGVRIQDIIYRVPGVKWLGENSYFYSTLFNSVWEFAKSEARSRAVHKSTPSRTNPEPAANEAFDFAVETQSKHSAYQTALAVALIKRMQVFCTGRGIRLIVVDVPQRLGDRQFVSSFSSEVLDGLAAAHTEYATSDSLFDDYRGAVELHVPHGIHHITEFTHALIGVELGRRILAAGKATSQSGVKAPEGASDGR
jgi:lysophospholipase L1-like esterase